MAFIEPAVPLIHSRTVLLSVLWGPVRVRTERFNKEIAIQYTS